MTAEVSDKGFGIGRDLVVFGQSAYEASPFIDCVEGLTGFREGLFCLPYRVSCLVSYLVEVCMVSGTCSIAGPT